MNLTINPKGDLRLKNPNLRGFVGGDGAKFDISPDVVVLHIKYLRRYKGFVNVNFGKLRVHSGMRSFPPPFLAGGPVAFNYRAQILHVNLSFAKKS